MLVEHLAEATGRLLLYGNACSHTGKSAIYYFICIIILVCVYIHMFICAPMCIWDLLRHTNYFKIAVKKKKLSGLGGRRWEAKVVNLNSHLGWKGQGGAKSFLCVQQGLKLWGFHCQHLGTMGRRWKDPGGGSWKGKLWMDGNAFNV